MSEMGTVPHRVQCSVFGCFSSLIWQWGADRFDASMLRLNGWHEEEGHWFCGLHPPSMHAVKAMLDRQ